MIVVTGAAGFIASAFIQKLNKEGFNDIIAVDNFSNPEKTGNKINLRIQEKIDRNSFFEWLEIHYNSIQFIVHLGARTDTTEFDYTIFQELNISYSQKMWEKCTQYTIPLIYASSAATYGNGEFGYNDTHEIISSLVPLNPYGESKNDFDKWAIAQEKSPYYWAGLKFFNVYGPNENHKGRMASVIFHAFNQIKENGKMKLFRSHHPDFMNGGQMRDFVYVKDVCNVIFWLMNHRKPENSGIYNLGTGKAETFLSLTQNTFNAMDIPEEIEFVDTPVDIRDKYQYFTEANMDKLHSIGYNIPFTSLEDGVRDYIQNYLLPEKYLEN